MTKRYGMSLALAAATLLVLAAPVSAQQIIGGHDETSEANAVLWATGAPGVGVGPAGVSGHLLLTEIIVTPTTNELVEIHNPTGAAVDLSTYYLSDAWFEPGPVGYHQLPTGTLVTGTETDFVARFPAGASIAAGGTIVVALYGPGVDSTFGAGAADYEVTSVSASIPDMVNVGGNTLRAGGTTLTNGSELIVLFFWDGASDNVCDVDYVTWGPATTTSRVDKTGIAIDGPDGDAIATSYNPDTADASQSTVVAPASGSSVARTSGTEGSEALDGNGCVSGGPTPAQPSTWGKVKGIYR